MSDEIKSYRDLKVWQKGIELVKAVYGMNQEFPKSEVYALSNQMQRAAVSIPSNIADGQARGHTSEFRQFLRIALGSAAELDTQLTVAISLGYCTEENVKPLSDQLVEIRKMTYSLIKSLPN